MLLCTAFVPGAPGASPARPLEHPGAKTGTPSPESPRRAPDEHFNLPLTFEPNQGQTDATVQFLAHGAGYSLFLAPGQVALNLERQQPARPAADRPPVPVAVDTVRMTLAGANSEAKVVGVGRQTGVVSYFIGNDPTHWRSGIPTYAKVSYIGVYPGVNLVFYGNQHRLEYDFVVAPGADPSVIAWSVDGARATLDSEGNLALRAANGPAIFQKPVLYQMDGSRKIAVDGAFSVAGNQIRFRLGGYDHSKALVIDPVLSYASYLGGSATDAIGAATGPGNLQVGVSQGLAVDGAGSVYVTGRSYSLNFPTRNPYQSAPPAKATGVAPGAWPSAFVSKFSPDGGSLVYSTYLGGDGVDSAYAIAVDSGGNAYVTGQTNSVNFPTTAGAYQTICSPVPNNQGRGLASPGCNSSNTSVFVTKLNAAGTGLVYSTFLGGYGWAYATAIAVDAAGRAYIAGNESQICSASFSFPSCFPTTTGAVIGGNQTGGASPQYAFAAALDPAGANLLYSTLFGDLNGFKCATGCGGSYGTVIAVDRNGAFYLAGQTAAGKLPTTAGVIQPNGAPLDAAGAYVLAWRGFIAKFNPVTSTGGASLAYATYLGGAKASHGDYISGIATDAAGNAYVAGYTNSPDFPVTAGAYQTVCGPNGQTCSAAHLTKLNPTATAMLWSTFVGGAKTDASDSVFFTGPVQLDGTGNVYLVGQAGPGFPTVNPVEPTPAGGSQQVLVAELDSSGGKLLFASTIGSNGLNTASPAGLAVDSSGTIYLAGNTNGPNLITTPAAFQTASTDGACCQAGNGFVVKIAPTVVPALLPGTLANGATYLAGGLVPGSWAQVKGANLSTSTRTWSGADFIGLGNRLPTNLGGVQVLVNNLPAAVYYISPTQITFQVPEGVTGTASVQVIANGQSSNPVTASAATHSPGIFPIIVNGVNYPAGVFLDGKYAGSPANGGAFRNAVPGDIVQLFATGLAPSPAGSVVETTLLSGVTVTIGGVTVPASAAALVAAGEFQINFVVPREFSSLAPGLYPISISIDGVTSPGRIDSSPPGPVMIPIQH